MIRYKEYPEYKESGIKWIGEIPDHWTCAKTGRFYKIGMGQTILKEDINEDGEWPVFSATEGDLYFGRINNPTVRLSPGDIVIPARGNSIGHAKLVWEKSTTTQTTIYCKRKPYGHLSERFAFYFFIGGREELFHYTQTAIPQITTAQVSYNPILIPTIEEQTAIATFLDRETSRIDRLIDAKKRFIERLKEKRQAMISHAVTKGLDPNAPMKDSGVEWIGEIPEGWEVKALKHSFSIIGGTTPSKEDTHWDGDINWFTPSDLKGVESLYVESSKRKITKKGFDSCGLKAIPEGSIILSSRAPIGSLGINMKEGTTNQGCKSLVPKGDLCINYFAYFLSVMGTALNNLGDGTTFKEISGSDLENFSSPFPERVEQERIAIYLSRETSRIDLIVEKVSRSIHLLNEKRTALITAAVTGKIDVRDEA